jgi:hypothetical protein
MFAIVSLPEESDGEACNVQVATVLSRWSERAIILRRVQDDAAVSRARSLERQIVKTGV